MCHLRWPIIFLFLVALFILISPWPSPRPFPFSRVHVKAGGGSRQTFIEKTYTSSLNLDTLKKYYGFQLRLFCEEWHWTVTDQEISTQCNPFTKQTFYLSLKSQSDGKVWVTQEDSWIEP